MTEGFEKGYTDARCEVQTPDIPVRHRDRQTLIGIGVEESGGQPTRFRSKDEAITVKETPRSVRDLRLRSEVNKP